MSMTLLRLSGRSQGVCIEHFLTTKTRELVTVETRLTELT